MNKNEETHEKEILKKVHMRSNRILDEAAEEAEIIEEAAAAEEVAVAEEVVEEVVEEVAETADAE